MSLLDLDFLENNPKDFKEIIKIYKTKEFIPISIIPNLISSLIPSIEIIHAYNSDHLICKSKIKDLFNAPIKNWDFNRPPDQIRCQDIANFLCNSKKPIDSMLFLNYNNLNESLEIIDGIHRFTALKMLYKENIKSNNLNNLFDHYSSNDLKCLFDQYIILNIRFNTSIGSLIDIFKGINKSNPIPEIYIRDTSAEKKKIIHNIANKWQILYKGHFSENSKPNKPNINRDRFIDLLDYIYEKHKICEENKELLDQLLENSNIYIKLNPPKKITKTILEKCELNNCYLFLHSIETLENII